MKMSFSYNALFHNTIMLDLLMKIDLRSCNAAIVPLPVRNPGRY